MTRKFDTVDFSRCRSLSLALCRSLLNGLKAAAAAADLSNCLHVFYFENRVSEHSVCVCVREKETIVRIQILHAVAFTTELALLANA